MTDQLRGFIQESVLTLLCFDDDAVPLVTTKIDVGLFESDIYKDIATAAVEYYEEFREAPKAHISNLLEEKIKGKNDRLGKLYEMKLKALYQAKDEVNSKYVLGELDKFVKRQRLKVAIVEAADLIKADEVGEAEERIEKALRTNIDTFDPGLDFSDTEGMLGFFESEVESYKTGIKPLDDINLGPAPGELFIVLGPANRGKTWALTHLGKWCAIQKLKVLHISLEMSEEKMAQRYIQSIFAMGRRESKIKYAKFMEDEMGRMSGIGFEELTRPTLKDKNAKEYLMSMLDGEARSRSGVGNRFRLRLKRFPTNGLNMRGLEAYLDGMERYHGFMPDVIILDYADLMTINSDRLRIDTGIIYKELRRIAVERNIAMVTASQSNRLGEDAKTLTLKHLAEDYSKAATADNIIAYSQTAAEQKLGLARLFIAKARNEARAQTILISQAYNMGQFCMQAIPVADKYWSELKALSGEDGDGGLRETVEGDTSRERIKNKVRNRVPNEGRTREAARKTRSSR